VTPARRGLGNWVRLAVGLAAAAAAVELGVRAVVFGWAPARLQPASLRRAGAFADPSEDLWWQLRRRFGEGVEPDRPASYDPELGWIPAGVVNKLNYDHFARRGLAQRRPVLLYGDSFAQCVTSERDCFQGLLEASELGARFALMNYGCGGYGLDQTYLMWKRSMGLWTELRPIVLFSLLVDDDLDRSLLELRGWAKPRFQIRDGELVLERERVPESTAWLADAIPPPTSWAWRALVRSRAVPRALRARLSGETRRAQRARDLGALMLEDVARELRELRLPFGFVLFHSFEGTRAPERLEWREDFLVELMEQLDAPYVLTREALAEEARATGQPLEAFFVMEAFGYGHLNAAGNAVVFGQVRDLLERLEPEDPYRPPLGPWCIEDTLAAGRFAAARYENGRRAPFLEPEDQSRLCLKVGRQGPTEASYALDGRARRFAGLAWTPGEPGTQPERVTLTLLADGVELLALEVRRGDPKLPFEVDLTGRQRLVVRAGDGGDGYQGDLLVISSPAFD